MVYIKVLNNDEALVGVEALETPGWVRYDSIHGMLMRCDKMIAQGILSSDASVAYNYGDVGISADYTAHIIDFAEYDSIRIHETDPEDTEPEVPDETPEETILTRAQLTAKVAELESANARLEEELQAAKILLGVDE